MPNAPTIASALPRLALLCACASLCGGVQAQAQSNEVLRLRCTTVMNYGPSPCHAPVPPAQDESDITIDLPKKLWSFGNAGGAIQAEGNNITLMQWGGQKGRDALIDRASGAFSYHFQSGCLVENETGSCAPAPN
jgi:hypothetical protein